MRFRVEVTPLGGEGTASESFVEAEQWRAALARVRALRGEGGDERSLSVEVLDAGYRVVDTARMLRYVVETGARVEGAPAPRFDVLLAKGSEPTEAMPLTYRERAVRLSGPPSREAVQDLLESLLDHVRVELASHPFGKVIELGVFAENAVQAEQPLGTLSFKDWRGGLAELWLSDALVPRSQGTRAGRWPSEPPRSSSPPSSRPSPSPTPSSPPRSVAPASTPRSVAPAASPSVAPASSRSVAPAASPSVAPSSRSVAPAASPSVAPSSRSSVPPVSSPPSSPRGGASEPPSLRSRSSTWPRQSTPPQTPPQSAVPQSAAPQSVPPESVPPESAAPRSAQPHSMPPASAAPQSTPPASAAPQSTPPRSSQRRPNDDLITDLFDGMHALDFVPDVVNGVAFVLDVLEKMLPSRISAVHVFDSTRRSYVLVGARGLGEAAIGSKLPETDAFFRWLRSNGRTRRLEGAQVGLSVVRGHLRASPPKRLMAAPIHFAGRDLGIVELGDPQGSAAYSEHEAAALDYIAERLGGFLAARPFVPDDKLIAAAQARAGERRSGI